MVWRWRWITSWNSCDYAHQALKSVDNRAIAKNHQIAAKRAYAEVSRLIFIANEIGQDERHGLDSKLEHLREMLEPLSAIGSTPTTDDIAELARALWKARGLPRGFARTGLVPSGAGLEVRRRLTRLLPLFSVSRVCATCSHSACMVAA